MGPVKEFLGHVQRPGFKTGLVLVLAGGIGISGAATPILGRTFTRVNATRDFQQIGSSNESGRQASTSVKQGADQELLGQECDCQPLWECMQREGSTCAPLKQDLQECLKRTGQAASRGSRPYSPFEQGGGMGAADLATCWG